MAKTLRLGFGVLSYAFFLLVFLYAVGFTGGFGVPKGIDDGPAELSVASVAVDLALLTLFALQHSVMARPAFKRWWTRYVPDPIERSTYVLLASLVLALLLWQWRSIPAVVWEVSSTPARLVVWALFWLGWGIVLGVDVHDQPLRAVRAEAGVRRAGGAAQARDRLPHDAVLSGRAPSAESGLHRRVLGGADDDGGPSAVRGGTTGWILLAMQLEERDLLGDFGTAYASTAGGSPC